ncbi:conserved hypothetical protein [Burkholderia latens]
MSIRFVIRHSARHYFEKVAAMRIRVGEMASADFRAIGKSYFAEKHGTSWKSISFNLIERRCTFGGDFPAGRLRVPAFIVCDSKQTESCRTTREVRTGRPGAALPRRVRSVSALALPRLPR